MPHLGCAAAHCANHQILAQARLWFFLFNNPFPCLLVRTRVVILHIDFFVYLFETFVASQQLRIRQSMISQEAESQDQDDTFSHAESHVQTTQRKEQFFCKWCQSMFAEFSYQSPDIPTADRFGLMVQEPIVESGCLLCVQLTSPLYDIRVNRIEYSWSYHCNSEGKGVLRYVLFNGVITGLSGSPPRFALLKSSDVREKYNTRDLYQNMLRGLPETTDNEATWGLIQRWLSDCSSTHSDCNCSAHSQENPTRLIDVELLMNPEPEQDRVLLVEPRAGLSEEKYATLSHCWGGQVPALLKKSETCERLSSGWAVNELPKTFREAVITTRKLGIRYIWIDSLCIQQDCEEDWKRESQTMDTVYSKSYLNIAATGAKNSSIGLFLERKPNHVQPFEADIRQYGGAGEDDIFTPYLFFRLDLWRTYVNESPLGRRGWVTQERELSPRQLNFTEAGAFWECRCLRDTEFPFDWPEYGSDTLRYKSLIRRIEAFEKMGSSMSESDRSTELDHIYNEWNNTIQGYSPSKFTKETDRPIAIAGLAKRMQPVVKDTYIAGLWKSRLLCQLLWKVDQGPPTASSHPGRLPQLLAPTWSWLSTGSPIAMFGSPQHSFTSLGDFRPVAQVVNDEPSHVEMDLNGELSGGYIRLRALHWPVSEPMVRTMIGILAGPPGFPIHIYGAPAHPQASGFPDEIPYPKIGTQQVVAVPMMVYPNCCATTGLLLRRIHDEEQEKYERFGVFEIRCDKDPEEIKNLFKSWVDELQRMTAETKLHQFKEFIIF